LATQVRAVLCVIQVTIKVLAASATLAPPMWVRTVVYARIIQFVRPAFWVLRGFYAIAAMKVFKGPTVIPVAPVFSILAGSAQPAQRLVPNAIYAQIKILVLNAQLGLPLLPALPARLATLHQLIVLWPVRSAPQLALSALNAQMQWPVRPVKSDSLA
jgi:hypothetical protein